MPPAAQAQAQAPPPQTAQQPPPQDDDGHLVALIVAALAAYWTVEGLTRALRAPFKVAGIGGAALSAAAGLMLTWPLGALEGTGPAQRWAVRANMARRASFLLNVARRTQAAIVTARSRNEPVLAAIRDALTAEKRYLSQHVQASTGRVQAATAVDGMASTYGPLLSWNAVKDSHTTAECRAADKHNFRADRPPIVGGQPAWPGTVHSRCRCTAGPPRRGAPMLPSS